MEADNVRWAAAQPEPNPYRREWEDLVTAIRSGTAYNEAVRGAEVHLHGPCLRHGATGEHPHA